MSRLPDNLLDHQHCACFNLRKTTRAMTQFYDRQMRSVGLRGTQFSILAVLSKAGAISITHLSEFLAMDRTTVTRNLRPLEKQAYLEILSGEDHRIRNVQITETGLKIFKAAHPIWKKAQSEIIQKLGEKRLQHLLKDLAETTAAIQ